MKKIFIFLSLSTLMLTVKAQDPQISSPTVLPSPGAVNGPVTFSVDFYNVSSVAIPNPDPVNGPTQVIFSCNKFAPTGGVTPVVTGPGSIYFNWTAVLIAGNWSVIGKQKAGLTIPGSTGFPPTYPGGQIAIQGTITAASTIAEATAFNGDGFNANIIPGDGGDINTGSGSNNQSSYGYTAAAGPLPLTLVDFNAKKNGTRADLAWVTATEQQTAYFSIERSGDGNTFTAIAKVAAAGNSTTNKNYAYTDAAPLPGTNYYRLKQADINGNYIYSAVRVVNFGAGATAISVYPVPATDILYIKGASLNATITITDAAGKMIFSKKVNSAIENILLGQFASGTYIINVITNNTITYTKRFIKGA